MKHYIFAFEDVRCCDKAEDPNSKHNMMADITCSDCLKFFTEQWPFVDEYKIRYEKARWKTDFKEMLK